MGVMSNIAYETQMLVHFAYISLFDFTLSDGCKYPSGAIIQFCLY